MTARIYQRPKSAMQSGKARTDEWVLEFEQSEARRADPLMGWTGSGDTQAQVQLKFPSKDEAKAYAEKYGIPRASTPRRRIASSCRPTPTIFADVGLFAAESGMPPYGAPGVGWTFAFAHRVRSGRKQPR